MAQSCLRYYHSIRLEKLRKTKKTFSQDDGDLYDIQNGHLPYTNLDH
jgi:hypothetical protein